MRIGPELQVVHQAHYTDLKKCEEGRQFWNLFTLFSEVLQLLFLTKTPPPQHQSKHSATVDYYIPNLESLL